ncbi:GIY-YIG nuclease family protein [Microbacterium sp. dk485]|uniref:GIY-YIG nuclease family protein n=1 Tax=Microbacterium sp. dk485 TaxID=2560021 RepID=UPI00107339A3|nr:GIY-YIG nuclease family protein [Microbacterium sp. dk485]TFV82375.1 GIY-YIG nuclease family protein [Microbacterium sp. dk485]
MRCLVDGCGEAVFPATPLPLCERHLAVAGEWDQRVHGVTDLLPSPCLVCRSRLGVRWPSGWLCAACEWRYGDVPDDDLPPPRVDVVYYLRYSDRVKIGTTANPRQRLAAIRHDDLLAFERGDRTLEQRRQGEFAADRFEGTEWFRLSERLAAHIAVLAAGVGDPWMLWTRWRSEALARRG